MGWVIGKQRAEESQANVASASHEAMEQDFTEQVLIEESKSDTEVRIGRKKHQRGFSETSKSQSSFEHFEEAFLFGATVEKAKNVVFFCCLFSSESSRATMP